MYVQWGDTVLFFRNFSAQLAVFPPIVFIFPYLRYLFFLLVRLFFSPYILFLLQPLLYLTNQPYTECPSRQVESGVR